MVDIIEELEKNSSNTIQAQELGNKTIVGRIVSGEFREDKQKNNCYYLTIEPLGKEYEGKVFIQKYTPSIMKDLANAFKNLGISDITKAPVLVFEPRKAGQSTFPRWFPIRKAEAQI